MEKQCSTCKLAKPVSEFRKHGNKPSYQCKLCCKLAPSKVAWSLERFKSTKWDSIRQRTVNSGSAGKSSGWGKYLLKGVRLEMTRAEFRAWCDEQSTQIAALVSLGEIPSVDRIRSGGHYSKDNIRVISYRENTDLGRRAGVLLVQRAVVGTHTVTGERLVFPSLAEAERAGFQRGNLCRCAQKAYGYRTHRSYRWEYAESCDQAQE